MSMNPVRKISISITLLCLSTGLTCFAQDSIPKKADPYENAVFMVAEQPAEYYENGREGLERFLWENVDVKKNTPTGKIFASLVIEKDGTVSDAQVIKGLEKTIDDEVVRVAKLTKWLPAKQNGRAVRSRYVIPVAVKYSKKKR